MEALAINVGWAVCSTLLMFPAEVCGEADHARFIGGAVLMLAALGVSIPLTLKAAHWLSPKPAAPSRYSKQPYQPLPPMPGPARKNLPAR